MKHEGRQICQQIIENRQTLNKWIYWCIQHKW